jgi:hypothetical protein
MLKNVLSLLLSKFYSKQESELVGHQAMPSSSVVRLTPKTTTIDGWDSVFDGVASTDGFACLRFTADSVYCIASAQTENINVFTTPQVAGDILLCACPVAKGQVFTLCARQAKNIECWFTKTIGGGYQTLKKLILQGGGLCCLKHSYSSLRRSSWLARRSGWLISRLIFLRPLQKLPSLLTENATPSQCLTRASWFCNVTASCLQDLTDLTWSISEREQTATSAFLFIPRKATLFLTRLANPTTSEPQTCTSIRLTVANNLSIGGVSC